MTLELPIVQKPIIRGYLHHAHTLSIIQNHDNADQWIYSRFLQLYCKNGKTDAVDFFVNPYNYECLDRGYIHSFYLDDIAQIYNYINKALKNGYYVLCLVDEFYLEQMLAYKSVHFDHWLFIYGYDETSFLSIGYTKNRVYKKYTVPFDVFNIAIKSCYGLTLYKMKEEYCFYYDKDLAQELVYDYTKGINTSYKIKLHNQPIEGYFGYKIYDYIKSNFNNISLPYLYVLYEHKKCVLDFLIRNHYAEKFTLEYKKVVDISAIIKNLFLKENIINHNRNHDSILRYIEKLKTLEMDVLNSIV